LVTEARVCEQFMAKIVTDGSRTHDLRGRMANIYINHRKYGSNTKTQQRNHKYKQDTIQNTTIKSITVADTSYWSINKISYIFACRPTHAQFTPPTRQDKTVLSASCLACRLLWTCSDYKFSVGDSFELSGIQFTPQKRTRHRQDSFVASGVAV